MRRCRYRFVIRDNDRFDDEEGVVLPDDLTARKHALGMIQELQRAAKADWADYTMEVTRDVWEIPFELAEKKKDALD